MREIRELQESEITALAEIGLHAYPGVLHTVEQTVELLHKHRTNRHLMGLFDDGVMLGGYFHFDFIMTLLDQPVTIGGIGGVAVHMLHKKQRVAYAMLQHFVRHCRDHQQPMALLYPFRPDFYRRMGFAYGTPVYEYRIHPAGIIQGHTHSHLRFGTAEDNAALLACYNRYAGVTHGMIQRTSDYFEHLWTDPALRCVLYAEYEQVRGYLLYRFRPAQPMNPLNNHLHVEEMIHETPAVLAELMTFLGRQADQTNRIIIETQEEHLLYLLDEPRNDTGRHHETSTQGIAWMPRVVDLPGIFRALADHDFGGQTLTLGIDLIDDFLPENTGLSLVRFQDGQATVLDGGDTDVTIRLHVREFTQLLLGIVDWHWLARVGLATSNDPTRSTQIHRLFAWHRKPVCMTFF